MCVTFLLANLIPSPVAVFTIMSPLLIASCEALDVSPSKAVFSLGLVGVGTCAILPFGFGAATFATQNGYLESYGYTVYQMELLDIFKGRIISGIIILLYAIFVAPRLAPAEPSTPLAMTSAKGKGKAAEPLDPLREFLGYAIFVVTTLGLIFSSQIHLASWQVAMTGAAVVVVSGVLKPKEAVAALPVRIVLMLIAALSVGGAMVECGLGEMIGDMLANALGGTTNGYVIGAAFFVVPFTLTQFMQNQSVSNIFIPILILACQSLECNPVGPMILLNAACLTAFMTPSATGTVPLMMGAGGYDQKDLVKMGWLPSLIICVASVICVMTIFPAFP